MLQALRDHSQSWLSAVVVFLVCAAFALWGIHSYVTAGSGQPEIVAKVNNFSIPQNDLTLVYSRLRQQQQMQLGADFVMDQKVVAQLKKQALNQLIMGQVLVQAAMKEGYRVSMGQVYGSLLMVPAFQVDGQFSRERFNEVLSSGLYNEKAFLSDMQLSMLTNQVRLGFIESAFVLPDEINSAVKLIEQKRDIGYFIIPVAHFDANIIISEAQARAYYDQHHEQFALPERVSIQYLAISLPQIAAQQHFSEEQLRQYYQDNVNNYTRPERWQVAHILVEMPANATAEQMDAAHAKLAVIIQHLNKGENFAKLAQKYSDDRISAKKGGVLEWFTPGMVEPAFEKAVAALAKPGALSSPVRTKYGFSIIKLLKVEKPQVLPFATVRSQVEKAMAHQQAERIFADASDKLSNLTYANPGSLDVAAKALGLEVKSTDFFDRQGGKSEITANPKVIAATFSPGVMHGNNSDVVDLNPDTLLVLRIKQKTPASIQPFTDVQSKVEELLKKQMAQQQASSFGEQMIQQLKQGMSGQQIAQQAKLDWHAVSAVARFSNQLPTVLTSTAFRMPRPINAATPTVGGVHMPNGDYAVLVLSAVHDGDFNQIPDSQKRIYQEELEDSNGQLDYALYVRGLVDKAKIKVNNSAKQSDQ